MTHKVSRQEFVMLTVQIARSRVSRREGKKLGTTNYYYCHRLNRINEFTLGATTFDGKQVFIYGLRIHRKLELAETVLHECAHVLTPHNPFGDGHGSEWKAKCREIGFQPYQYVCDEDEKEIDFEPSLWKALNDLPEPEAQ